MIESNLPRHPAALPKTNLEKISSKMGVKVRIPAFAGMTQIEVNVSKPSSLRRQGSRGPVVW